MRRNQVNSGLGTNMWIVTFLGEESHDNSTLKIHLPDGKTKMVNKIDQKILQRLCLNLRMDPRRTPKELLQKRCIPYRSEKRLWSLNPSF